MLKPTVYTPEQVAEILQLNKNTVYKLIKRGEIVAKKLGRTYRIPASSLSFAFTGLDKDLLAARSKDKKTLPEVEKELEKVRSELWESE